MHINDFELKSNSERVNSECIEVVVILQSGGSQGMGPGPAATASPGNLLQCKFLHPTESDPLKSETMGWGPAIYSLINAPGDSDACLINAFFNCFTYIFIFMDVEE